jgi:hypothetical protein
MIYTFASDPYWRTLLLLAGSVLILVVHLSLAPFRDSASQRIETVALSVLVIVAVIQARLATLWNAGVDPRGTSLSSVQTASCCLNLVCCFSS